MAGSKAAGAVVLLLLLVLAFGIYIGGGSLPSVNGGRLVSPVFFPHRKLLHRGGGGGAATVSVRDQPDRIGDGCSKEDVVVYQGPTAPLPNGIPTYTVQILNLCVSGCSVSRIHLSCGWFSSARLINPRLFRRVRYDDCLVNDGRPLPSGGSVSFQYANSFNYPLAVSAVTCD